MKIRKNGFTLIEVILVLAVGSLIFAMAFLAYGQASINRRDTQRRADLGKIASELENYASDNNGKYPSYTIITGGTDQSFTDLATNYISNLKDPSTEIPYTQTVKQDDYVNGQPGSLLYFPEVFYHQNFEFCDGSTGAAPRDYVLKMKLEKGVACRDSKQ